MGTDSGAPKRRRGAKRVHNWDLFTNGDYHYVKSGVHFTGTSPAGFRSQLTQQAKKQDLSVCATSRPLGSNRAPGERADNSLEWLFRFMPIGEEDNFSAFAGLIQGIDRNEGWVPEELHQYRDHYVSRLREECPEEANRLGL